MKGFLILWRSSSWKWTLRGGNEFHLPWQFEVKGGEMIKRPRTKSFADESRSLSIFGVLACNVQKKKQKWVQRTLVLKIAVVYCMFCKEVKGWPRNAYFFLDHKYDLLFCFFRECMEDGRSMTTFYHCYVNHQSRLQSNTFSKLSYIFLICTSKCAADYVIWFGVYDDLIGQKIWAYGRGPSFFRGQWGHVRCLD